MKLEVLVSTMHQTDYSLLDKMNIQCDAIVVNQCEKNEIVEFDYKGHKIKWMSLAERGVGLSRNTALMRATGDILLFADDDVVYENNYVDTVLSVFRKNPKAGLITFNLYGDGKGYDPYVDVKDHKIHLFNCLKYGSYRIAIRRENILLKNIYYSLYFGGGAKYQSGEDNLFISNCLQKKILCLANSKFIAKNTHGESTWFKGYNEKFYLDKGALFSIIFGKKAKFMLFLIELKNSNNDNNISFLNRLKLTYNGIIK